MKAVILAAGLGSRLNFDRPKGLLEVGGQSLVERSLGLLARAGMAPVTLVVGYRKEHYLALPGEHRFIESPDFQTTGNLRSLLLAYDALQDDLLVLESDILYEYRALERILATGAANAIVTAGISGAGDEVWVDAEAGRLRGLTKIAAEVRGPIAGEFVGISKFSRPLLESFNAVCADNPAAHYDTGGLTALAGRHPIETVAMADLVWCEVDDPQQLQRCVEVVYPRLQALV